MMREYGKDDKALILQKLQNDQQEFQGDSLQGIDLSSKKFRSFQGKQCKLTNLRWSQSYLEEMILRDTSVSQCRFDRFTCQKLKLRQSTWEECNCQEADFSQGRMLAWKVIAGAFQNVQFFQARIITRVFKIASFPVRTQQLRTAPIIFPAREMKKSFLENVAIKTEKACWALKRLRG